MESNERSSQEREWQRSYPENVRLTRQRQIQYDHRSYRKTKKDRSQNREDVSIGLPISCRLQWKLRQRNAFLHGGQPLLMNDLEPLLPAQMLHVNIPDKRCG